MTEPSSGKRRRRITRAKYIAGDEAMVHERLDRVESELAELRRDLAGLHHRIAGPGVHAGEAELGRLGTPVPS